MEQRNENYDEISLKELLMALWQERVLLISVLLVTVLLTAVYTFFIAQPVYEASSELIIKTPKKGETLSANTLYGSYQFPTTNPLDYINFIKSSEVAKKVVSRAQLDQTVSVFQKSINIEQDKDANRFIITTSANQADRAAEINTTLVNAFIETQRINYKRYAIEGFILNFERVIENLNISIESKQRLLQERKALLDQIKPIFTLQKSLFDDPETAAAYADKFDLDLNELSQNMLVAEQAHEIYFKMEEHYINTEDELINLRESLTNNKARLAELKAEKQLLIDALNDGNLATVLNGRVDVFADMVLVVSPAIAPQHPVAPRKVLNLAIGVALGTMLGIFAAFFRNYWKNS